jgi:chlorophyllide a hydrolase
VDVQFNQSLSAGQTISKRSYSVGQWMLGYWVLATVLGLIFLRDWLMSWNVAATFANPWLVVLLISTFLCGQILYFIVARHDGRPLRWGQTLLFSLGNGLAETFAFALVYRLGMWMGAGVTSLFAPSAADAVGFGLGLVFFIIYGGLIHALFWLPLLPPHLDDAPLSRRIRKLRPFNEVALVVGWSLCLWLYNDIWTMVFFHVLVDLGLMLRVRPVLFGKGE